MPRSERHNPGGGQSSWPNGRALWGFVVFPELPDNKFSVGLRRRLLRWFRQHRRDFPWRSRRDPYAIWVSEVMLQQTQAATVTPYFQRFLETFPDLSKLAQAPVEAVFQIWNGLGYYRRALALHQAAKQLMAEYAGRFPRDPAVLQRLPGIGRYTAHAILSQAFDLPLPIVEANSARVYARLFACDQPLTQPPVRRWLWQVAERLLPTRGSGTFNQAVMELGATVCLPRAPRCANCPVASFCLGHRLGRVDDIPVMLRQRPATRVMEVAVLIHRAGRWLVLQRAVHAHRWPLLWEFPHAEMVRGESQTEAVERVARELTGLKVTALRFLGRVRFAVTRFRVEMVAWCALARAARVQLTPVHRTANWLDPDQLPYLCWSAPQQRILALLDGVTA